MDIYLNGCSCGINGVYVRSIKRYARSVGLVAKVLNSKYSPEFKAEHQRLLAQSGLPIDDLPGILVYNGEVTLLKLWNT